MLATRLDIACHSCKKVLGMQNVFANLASTRLRTSREDEVPDHPGASGAPDFLRLIFGEEQWEPAFELGITGMTVAGHPDKPGIYVLRVHWPPNVMSLPHSHPEDRHVTVLSGTWWTGTGEAFDPDSAVPLSAGAYMLHPAGMTHWDGSKDEETVIQLIGYGPSEMNPVTPGPPFFTKVGG
jgi:quercetin dioxygenase-like cupin family protein